MNWTPVKIALARSTLTCAALVTLAASDCRGRDSAAVAEGMVPRVARPITLTPEVELTSPAIGPARGDQIAPAVAFDGENHLVVWTDFRDWWSSQSDIFAARVSASGEVLDPHPIVISGAPARQQVAKVAFGGGVYLVVWEDMRTVFTSRGGELYAARVTPAGEVLDPDGINLGEVDRVQAHHGVAFDGTHFLLAWEDYRSGYAHMDVFGMWVSTDGSEVGDGRFAISAHEEMSANPKTFCLGEQCLVFWWDFRDDAPGNYASRVDRGGALDPQGIRLATATGGVGTHAVSHDHENLFVAWQTGRDEPNYQYSYDLYGARLSPAGAVLAPGGFPLISIVDENQHGPALAYDGEGYILAWQDSRDAVHYGYDDVYVARVTRSGQVLDPLGIPVAVGPASKGPIAIAAGAESTLLVWADSRTGLDNGPDIRGSRISREGEVLDPDGFPVTFASADQGAPAVAHDGERFLVVWRESRLAYTMDVYGARVDREGEVLDPEGLFVATASDTPFSPGAAFGDGHYLVTRFLSLGIPDGPAVYRTYGTFLAPDGEVVDDVLLHHWAYRDSRLAFAAGHFLVVWPVSWGGRNDIGASLIARTADGTSNQRIDVSLATDYDQRSPVVAGSEAGFLVVWESDREAEPREWDLFAARINHAGAVLDPEGIPLASGPGVQGAPAVTFDGKNYLVVWQEGGDAGLDVRGARVSPLGRVLDTPALEIAVSGGDQHLPAVAGGAGGSLVAWVDERAGVPQVYGARVSLDGVVLQPSTWVLSPAGPPVAGVAVASDGAGSFYVAHSRCHDGPPHDACRVSGRLVRFDGLGEACEEGDTCLSGWCVDGVCCDHDCGGGQSDDCQVCSVAAGAAVDGVCAVAPPGALCRPAAGECDDEELCDGVRTTCPHDWLAFGDRVCRPAADVCDHPERCTGESAACPEDRPAEDGVVCPGGRCVAGACEPSTDAGANPDGSAAGHDAGRDGGAGRDAGLGGDAAPAEGTGAAPIASEGCGCRILRGARVEGVLLLVLCLGACGARRRAPRPAR